MGRSAHSTPTACDRLSARAVAVGLGVFQAADLVVTQTQEAFGEAHLDHLGVPRGLRPVLPVVKGAAAVALLATPRHPHLRRATATALVAYYAAATAFHVLSGDGPKDVAPAAVCCASAAWLVMAEESPR